MSFLYKMNSIKLLKPGWLCIFAFMGLSNCVQHDSPCGGNPRNPFNPPLICPEGYIKSLKIDGEEIRDDKIKTLIADGYTKHNLIVELHSGVTVPTKVTLTTNYGSLDSSYTSTSINQKSITVTAITHKVSVLLTVGREKLNGHFGITVSTNGVHKNFEIGMQNSYPDYFDFTANKTVINYGQADTAFLTVNLKKFQGEVTDGLPVLFTYDYNKIGIKCNEINIKESVNGIVRIPISIDYGSSSPAVDSASVTVTANVAIDGNDVLLTPKSKTIRMVKP